MSYHTLEEGEKDVMNVVSRRENKYLINIDTYRKSYNYLRKIIKEDKHNISDGYLVRSLYFDTIDDKDFAEKEDGVEIRRKLRIRVYDSHSKVAYLEIKQKNGNYQQKRTLQITKKDAEELIKCNYSVLLNYEEDFAKEVYVIMSTELYQPKCVVDYHRLAFVVPENSIRITFDFNIMATESSFDIFNPNLPLYPVLDRSNIVLEVKYNGFLLSYLKDAIEAIDKSRISVSKYCLARNVSKNYLF